MNQVLVLHASLPAGPCPAGLLELLKRLPYAKRLEIEGRDPRAQCASLAGIAMALRGAAGMRPDAVEAGQLRFTDGGKPRLVGGPSFSVSHGGLHVGVALCSEGEVGFDLELIDPRAAEPAGGRSRLLRWTATEAVLKADGRGLREARDVDLAESLRTGSVGGRSFHLSPVTISNDIVACLATGKPADMVRVEKVEASALVP
jgi:phosphopantetheinyl transferase